MVDVWWGICERAGPRMYDFSAYKRLFHKCAAAGLRVQVRGLSIHMACVYVCNRLLPSYLSMVLLPAVASND